MKHPFHNMVQLLGLLALLAITACAPDGEAGFSNPQTKIWANRVVTYDPVLPSGVTSADWPYFFQPEAALGEPGDAFGVVSLGFDPTLPDALGGSITLGLGLSEDPAQAHCIVDGEGGDFIVYENPFVTREAETGAEVVNVEVALVELSEDGLSWFQFPIEVHEALPLGDPGRYAGFAGVTPVHAGGDGFDLERVIQAHGLSSQFQACYVRLTDGGTRFPDYGNTQTDLWHSGADINAVEVLHGQKAGL